MSEKTIIIGAGFASATLSNLINDQNLMVFDKGRGPGGRSSTRRVENIGLFDHGLQYISPTIKEFDFFLNQKFKTLYQGMEWKLPCL